MTTRHHHSQCDNTESRLSWEPLPCPWYWPSLRGYRFRLDLLRGRSVGEPCVVRGVEAIFILGGIVVMTGFFFLEKFTSGAVTGILLTMTVMCRWVVQMHYRPCIYWEKTGYFYLGKNPLPFDRIQLLQIVPTGKKKHCQVIALLKDGSRKLLIHGEYRHILALTFLDKDRKAAASSPSSLFFLDAVAPIRDGAMFPPEYVPPSPNAQSVSYKPSPGISLIGADDLATFNREYTARGFNEAILWADAYSKGSGFKPLPLNLFITVLESLPERLNRAGIKTAVRVDDFDECCVRSIDSGCCFTGLNLTVEFDGHPVCLLCFIKVPFLYARKIKACFYCENEKLLEALKHAGLDKEK